MDLRIRLEITTNFTADESGRMSSEIKYSAPGHPELELNDRIRKGATEHASELLQGLLSSPDAFPDAE